MHHGYGMVIVECVWESAALGINGFVLASEELVTGKNIERMYVLQVKHVVGCGYPAESLGGAACDVGTLVTVGVSVLIICILGRASCHRYLRAGGETGNDLPCQSRIATEIAAIVLACYVIDEINRIVRVIDVLHAEAEARTYVCVRYSTQRIVYGLVVVCSCSVASSCTIEGGLVVTCLGIECKVAEYLLLYLERGGKTIIVRIYTDTFVIYIAYIECHLCVLRTTGDTEIMVVGETCAQYIFIILMCRNIGIIGIMVAIL